MSSYSPYELFADEADDYLDQHNIYELFGNLVKQLAMQRPKDPYSFMVNLLEQPTCVPKIIVIGPPGAGSTTQVAYIAKEYGAIPLHVDSLIRTEIANKTPNGEKLKKLQERAEPFPEELMTSIIGSRLAQGDCVSHGWVLDGYPRTLAEVQSLQRSKFNIMCNKFILLECSEAVVRGRLALSGNFTHLSEAAINEKYTSFHQHLNQFIDLFPDNRTQINSEKAIPEVWAMVREFINRSPASKAPRRPMRVLILGPTGSGKTTQSRMLSNTYGLVHISVGELLRKEAAKSSDTRDKIEVLINIGALVPDNIVNPLVCQRLLQSDCRSKGWILDGFPRTREQAQALASFKLIPNRCIMLDLKDDDACNRLRNRRIDPTSNDVYDAQISNLPPSIAGRLVSQPKDEESNLKNSLREFRISQQSLEQEYKKVLKRVDATQAQSHILSSIKNFLESSLGHKF